jgi:hypothetical protein
MKKAQSQKLFATQIKVDLRYTECVIVIFVFEDCQTLVAHMDWSSGWNNLKQNPSFLDGLSMILQVFSKTVPTQWLLWK